MNKLHKEKLYNRLTYLAFICLVLATLILPMFSIKTITGLESSEDASSVSALQVIRVGLSSEDALLERQADLLLEYNEYKDELIQDGKSIAEVNKMLLDNAAYSEYRLIEKHLMDTKAIKPLAIALLATYSLAGVLALLFVLAIIIRKDKFDIFNIFATAVVAVAAIVSLVLAMNTTIVVSSAQHILLCSELMMYVIVLLPVMLVIAEVIQTFVLARARKVKENEIIKPFTGMEEENK